MACYHFQSICTNSAGTQGAWGLRMCMDFHGWGPVCPGPLSCDTNLKHPRCLLQALGMVVAQESPTEQSFRTESPILLCLCTSDSLCSLMLVKLPLLASSSIQEKHEKVQLNCPISMRPSKHSYPHLTSSSTISERAGLLGI